MKRPQKFLANISNTLQDKFFSLIGRIAATPYKDHNINKTFCVYVIVANYISSSKTKKYQDNNNTSNIPNSFFVVLILPLLLTKNKDVFIIIIIMMIKKQIK